MGTGSDKQQGEVPQDPDPEARPDTDDDEKDEVQEQSEESFPASDPPSY